MFPGASSDIGSDKFEPAYYLLDKHRFSNFEVRPFRFDFIFWQQIKVPSINSVVLVIGGGEAQGIPQNDTLHRP